MENWGQHVEQLVQKIVRNELKKVQEDWKKSFTKLVKELPEFVAHLVDESLRESLEQIESEEHRQLEQTKRNTEPTENMESPQPILFENIQEPIEITKQPPAQKRKRPESPSTNKPMKKMKPNEVRLIEQQEQRSALVKRVASLLLDMYTRNTSPFVWKRSSEKVIVRKNVIEALWNKDDTLPTMKRAMNRALAEIFGLDNSYKYNGSTARGWHLDSATFLRRVEQFTETA